MRSVKSTVPSLSIAAASCAGVTTSRASVGVRSRRGRSLAWAERGGLLSGQRDDGHQQERSSAERPHRS